MHKLSRILLYELKTTLLRPSFIIITLVVPLILLALFGIRTLTIRDDKTDEVSIQPTLVPEGYIDQSGLVRHIPPPQITSTDFTPDIPAGILHAYPDESSAQAAMKAGHIQAYYIIPADYLLSGKLVYVRQEYSPLAEDGLQDWVMRWVLMYNLVGEGLASRAWTPAVVTENNLSAAESGLTEDCPIPGYTCETNIYLRLLPLAILVVFMVTIMVTSSTLLQNMSKEKENRLLEVLLNAASPNQLLAGKILGLGILGLLQVTLWLGAIYIVINHGQLVLDLPPGLIIPASFIAWGFIFFLLGYALYACMMAGAGAMIPDAKSYTSTAFIVAAPMYLGYMVTFFMSYDPNSPLMTVLSLIPFTSPVTMPWRMVHGTVPDWQPLLAGLLLLATTFLIARAVGRIFRAQVLLSGQPFDMRHYLSALWHPDAAA
jgi:ABC-2 type transport system permease protein